MSEYPEHDKLKEVEDQSQRIGEFIEWLQSKGMTIAADPGTIDELRDADTEDKEYRRNFLPVPFSINDLLSMYFDIDQEKLEEEKRDMLEKAREDQS